MSTKRARVWEPPMLHEAPVRSWQIVTTDLFNFDGQDFLLIAEYYSKYQFVCKLKEFSNHEVIKLTKQIFREQGGAPERDNGPHYSFKE